MFVDLTGTLLHQALQPTIARTQVPGRVRARARAAGWPDARVTDLSLTYEPVWELEGPRGRRVAVAARPGLERGFALVELPSGERIFVEPDVCEREDAWLEPELAPESAAEVAARALERPVAASSIRLIHRPVYRVRARMDGEERAFRVDAATGDMLDADWPVRPTYRHRNQTWTATALMVAISALLPLPWSILGASAAALGTVLWRPAGTARDPGRTP